MASVAATNTGVPLLYGIVPIVTLFLVQQLISFLSLKSESIRKAVCGQPLLLISRGVVQEKALKSARYTITDLTEQLRGKDVFTLSNVEYAILETNGELSVLLKGPMQQPTYRDFAMPSPDAAPALMLIQDGAKKMFGSVRSVYFHITLIIFLGCIEGLLQHNRTTAQAFFYNILFYVNCTNLIVRKPTAETSKQTTLER